MTIRLHTLGQSCIEVGASRIGPEAERLFALLLYLAVERGKEVSRVELRRLLWPDADATHATHSLRQLIYRAKRMGVEIESSRTAVRLLIDDTQVDFLDHEHSLAALKPQAQQEVPAGGFLPGYLPNFSREFSNWLERQRDSTHAHLRRVLVEQLIVSKSRGDWRTVEALALRCLELDPLNEEATLARAEAAAADGSKARALQILDAFAKEIGPRAKGIQLPVHALQRRISEGRFERRPFDAHVPFVGRQEEFRSLSDSLSHAVQGGGAGLWVWGEPGIGKSRLVAEFTKAARLRGIAIARVCCHLTDRNRPLSAFIDLAPQLLRMRGVLGCSPGSMQLLRVMAFQEPCVSPLRADHTSPGNEYGSVKRALLDALESVAQETTTVLVLEDAHWLDRLSRQVLAELSHWCASRTILLLVTSRDPMHQSGESGALRSLKLEPISDAASAELVEALVRGTGFARTVEFSRWCTETAGGNPYHLTELALNGYSDQKFKVPESLHAVVLSRFSSLSSRSRRTLQICAILDHHATLERLEAVTGTPTRDFLDVLDELEERGLLTLEGNRIGCRHDLLAKIALTQLSEASLSVLHRHAAKVLEVDARHSPEASLVWACAEHWRGAGDLPRAVAIMKTCADHLLSLGLPSEAAALLKRALSLSPSAQLTLDLLARQASALELSGATEEQIGVLQRSIELRRQLYPHSRRHDEEELRLLEAMGRANYPMASLFPRLITCAAEPTAPSTYRLRAANLAIVLGYNLCATADIDSLMLHIAPALETKNASNPDAIELRLSYERWFGDLERSVALANRLVDLARSDTQPRHVARALRIASLSFQYFDATPSALAAAEEALQIAMQNGYAFDAVLAAARLSDITLGNGQLESAEYWIARQIELLRSACTPFLQLNCYSHQTELAIRKHEYKLALQYEQLTRAATPAQESLHCQMQSAALRTWVALLGDVPFSETEVESLVLLHGQTRNCNDHDFFAAALVQVLKKIGRHQQASALAKTYVATHRRDRRPVPQELCK